MRTMPKAVLWDMDGTLIDSEDHHWHSWRETMSTEGIEISHQQFLATFGQRNDAIIPAWLGDRATPGAITRFGEAKEERYRRLVRQRGVAATAGAADWVRRLRAANWLQAIASSAPRPNIEIVLEVLGLGNFFDAIVSAEDVANGKPDPEVFLTAAKRLRAESPECIVVEDAPAGVEAAKRAGMHCIALGLPSKLGAADVVVSALSQLEPDAFDRLLANSGTE
jgi:beta-phosphoglucomutase